MIAATRSTESLRALAKRTDADPGASGDAAQLVAKLTARAEGDRPYHVAVVGQNRKLVVFPLDQVPEMARGKGVRLQRYKDGGISDARVFAMADGLSWTDSAGRVFVVAKPDLKEWIGNRADAGRLPPRGFPKNNRFG